MRNIVTTLAEIVGLALVAVGAGMVYLPAGVIVAGLAFVLIGWTSA